MRLLKIHSLKPVKEGWVDKDMIMLHSCFQLLVDFVEQEDGLNHCNYEYHKESIDTAKRLYDWWQENKDTIDIDDAEADEKLIELVKMRGFLWT